MPQSDQLDAIADELAVRKVLDEYCLRLRSIRLKSGWICSPTTRSMRFSSGIAWP